jgi:hypothetical protein
MTTEHGSAFSRRDLARALRKTLSLEYVEGAGNAGRAMHPQTCAQENRNAHKKNRETDTCRHSLRDGVTAAP